MNANQKGGSKAPANQSGGPGGRELQATAAPRNRQSASAGSGASDPAGSERRPFGFLRLRQRHARRDA
jgi:hypothetical protein